MKASPKAEQEETFREFVVAESLRHPKSEDYLPRVLPTPADVLVSINKVQYGPFTLDYLRWRVAVKQTHLQTWVRRSASRQWVRLIELFKADGHLCPGCNAYKVGGEGELCAKCRGYQPK